MRALFFILFFITSMGAISQIIEFVEPDWQQAMEKARKENKLIMIYTNTLWCEPCLDMEEGTFQGKVIHDYYSKNFVNVPFDAEGFPGAEIADKYDSYVYPGFIFVNSYGELVHKGCGWMDEDQFLQLGKDAMNEPKTLRSFNKRYLEGERSKGFLAEYSFLLDASCVGGDNLVKSFFKDLPTEKWAEEASWTMINLNVFDPYSDQFEYLTSNYDLFIAKYGSDTVDAKIYDVLLRQFVEIYEGEDLTLFANQALQKIVKSVDFAQKDELESMINLQYSELVGDWELYASSVIKVIDEQAVNDSYQLNEFAWKFYLNVDEQAQLNKAIGWMEEVLITEKTATSLDTYASLLFKSGRVKESIKWEKEALKNAEESLEELTHYQLQLAKFKIEKK